MNHDITHCSTDMCKKRDKCFRALAWKEAQERNYQFVPCYKEPCKLDCFELIDHPDIVKMI